MHTPPSLSIAALPINQYFRGEAPANTLDIVKQAGFDFIHFTDKWTSLEPVTESELEHIQECLQTAGLKVQDVHGTHPVLEGVYLDLSVESPEARAIAFQSFRQRLKLTHALGGDAMVYHVPTRPLENDAILDRYVEGLKSLEDEARSLGVVVALENHYRAENDKKTFSRCFETFDPEYIGYTMDTGHACMSGNLDWLLAHCMDRLKILHLNDNDGKKDLHHMPYWEHGQVDWDAVARGIAKSPYRKALQMELKRHEEIYPTFEEFVQAAKEAILKLHHAVQEQSE